MKILFPFNFNKTIFAFACSLLVSCSSFKKLEPIPLPPSEVRLPAEAPDELKFGPDGNITCKNPASPLFQETSPLDLKLRGPFPIQYQDEGRSNPVYEATMEVYDQDHRSTSFALQIQGRGKSRARFCEFNPLRLIWKKQSRKEMDNTPFARLKGDDIKVVVHCLYSRGKSIDNPKASELVYKEYTLYKILSALGLPSFAVRLAKMNYANKNNEFVVDGMAFFIEPNGSVASRCQLNHAKNEEYMKTTNGADPRMIIPYFFSRMITKTGDFYVSSSHNSESFFDSSGKAQIIFPYDFNDSTFIQSRGYDLGLPGEIKTNLQDLKNRTLPPNDVNWSHFATIEENLWIEAYRKYARLILSRREQGLRSIEESPLSAQSQAEIRSHLLDFFKELELSY